MAEWVNTGQHEREGQGVFRGTEGKREAATHGMEVTSTCSHSLARFSEFDHVPVMSFS